MTVPLTVLIGRSLKAALPPLRKAVRRRWDAARSSDRSPPAPRQRGCALASFHKGEMFRAIREESRKAFELHSENDGSTSAWRVRTACCETDTATSSGFDQSASRRASATFPISVVFFARDMDTRRRKSDSRVVEPRHL